MADHFRSSWRRGVPVLALLVGCGLGARLTRPEGDGGWSAERRARELGTLAERGGVSWTGAPPERAVSASPLTLPDALALATTRNRRIAQAEKQLAVMREQVWAARGRLLPATAGSGRYTWYTDPLTNRLDLPRGLVPAGASSAITIREAEVGVLNGTVTAPIDVWGELQQGLAAAQAGYRGERARLWATRLDEQVAVVRAYYRLLEAERLRKVTEETLAAERRQLASAESRFESGRLTKNDLLIVQVAVRSTEQRLRQRDLAIADARWALNQAVGLAVDAPTAVADVTERPTLPSIEEALAQAWATNPVVTALLEEQQRLEATASALARSRLPRLSGGGAVDYSSSDILQPQTVGSGFVGFTWDLGTDTRREAEIAQAELAAERNRIVLEAELRGLEAALRFVQQAAAERLAALDAAAIAVGQAEENLRIREQQFDAGRATSDDVLEAEAVLAAQRATLASALYQAHARRAELQQLMGTSLEALAPAR
jgi:outer membrane protein TolC